MVSLGTCQGECGGVGTVETFPELAVPVCKIEMEVKNNGMLWRNHMGEKRTTVAAAAAVDINGQL